MYTRLGPSDAGIYIQYHPGIETRATPLKEFTILLNLNRLMFSATNKLVRNFLSANFITASFENAESLIMLDPVCSYSLYLIQYLLEQF